MAQGLFNQLFQQALDTIAKEKEELCPLAMDFRIAVYDRFGTFFLHGATAEQIAEIQRQVRQLYREYVPQTTQSHFPSFTGHHRCVTWVYADMQERISMLPPPQQLPTEPPAVILGNDTLTLEPVRLRTPERMRGMYVLGMNGTGKSTLLLEMMRQDMEAGNGLCLLDPHGDLTNAILDRVPPKREADVIILDVDVTTNAWGLNLFACPDPTSPRAVTRTVDQVLQAFGKIWGDIGNTPGLADMLRMITITLVSNPGTTMGDVQRVLTNDDFRNDLVANVQDQIVREFWELEYNPLSAGGKQQMRASLLRRFRALMTPLMANIVTQPTNSVDFRNVMDEGKILLVQLDAELEDMTSMLGTVLVGQLLQAALSRKDVEKDERRPFFLYADEYHRFATPFFGTLIQEARKYNIATVVAHQSRYQLRVLGEAISKIPLSVPTIAVFQVTAEDARELVGRFTQPDYERDIVSYSEWQRGMLNRFVNMPLYTAYCKTARGEYHIKPEHHTLAPNFQKRERLRAQSRERYYRDVHNAQQPPETREVGGDDAPFIRPKDWL